MSFTLLSAEDTAMNKTMSLPYYGAWVLWVHHRVQTCLFGLIPSIFLSALLTKVEGILLEDLQESSQVQKQTNKKA